MTATTTEGKAPARQARRHRENATASAVHRTGCLADRLPDPGR